VNAISTETGLDQHWLVAVHIMVG